MRIRIIAALLALLMLTPALFACGKKCCANGRNVFSLMDLADRRSGRRFRCVLPRSGA